MNKKMTKEYKLSPEVRVFLAANKRLYRARKKQKEAAEAQPRKESASTAEEPQEVPKLVVRKHDK